MNVLYITVDALRADHVTSEVMPTTRSLADQGIEFTDCIANGPGTPWSFPSLLSSRYSGATDGFGIPPAGDSHPTLAEVLRSEGYRTAGFTDNRFASSDYHYDRGMMTMFDSQATSKVKRLKQAIREQLDHDGFLYQGLLRGYHVIDDLLLNVTGQESRFVRSEILVDQLLDWVGDQNNDWFAWLHPMDVHAPYEAPPEYQRQFLDEPIDRRISQKLASKATHHPDELDEEDWALQGRLYKAECAYLDDQLARLFNELGEALNETLVVLTADHGDMHGEHGLGGHPQQFWEEVIHVPCAISMPYDISGTYDEQIGLVDIPPTILDALDVTSPDEWDGRSVLPSDKDHPDSRQHVFIDVGAELDRNLAGIRRADGWKLVRHGDEGELLLNLNSHPSEDPAHDQSTDVVPEYDELTNILDDHLDEMERRRKGDPEGIENEEMIEDHLRELGYLE